MWTAAPRPWSAPGAPAWPDGQSNVQFGEGGAGTFSDGKLTTGTHDGRRRRGAGDLSTCFGAPADILWSARPHIGTDILRQVGAQYAARAFWSWAARCGFSIR
jgi:uncharacterized FAD-dependent dehydrogenase